jgi:hypothetical protein
MDLAENLHTTLLLGQNVELCLCVERMEVREMLLLGPSSFLLSLSIARGLSI